MSRPDPVPEVTTTLVNDDRTVWYRKWRPQTFAEIIGQEHVTRTLRNAVATGRIAHAYLLCGPRGTGKTTTARVLAKAVNCATPHDGEPCDHCESCIAVREGRALDLVEMDAASNRGIDDIRDLRDRVGYAASGGRYKVYLIDEVHELTQQAFDALLKTLEEPPAHVIFVLATTDVHRVPATIVSRCQRFDLARARPADIATRLRLIADAEGLRIEDEALQVVARAATGSFRDANGLLEQLAASYGRAISTEQARAGLGLVADARALDLARAALNGDLTGGLALIAAVRDDGIDLRRFARDVAGRLRSVLLLRAGVEDAALDGDLQDEARTLAAGADLQTITRALKAFGSADFRADPQASLPLELALVEVVLRPDAVEQPPAPTFSEARKARRTAEPAPATPVTSAATAVPDQETTPPAPVDQRSALIARLAEGEASRTTAEPATGVPAVMEASHPPAPVVSDPAPAATPDQPGSLTLADAREHYRQVYESLRSLNRLAATRLQMGDIIAVDTASITFGLPHRIQVERLAGGTEEHRVLVEVIAQVFGRPYAVHCIQKSDVEDRLRAQPTRRSHLLDEAIKLGARPLNSP